MNYPRTDEDSSEWHPYIRQYGFYDPIMVGSIDGTDDVPHDRAVSRALSSEYCWKRSLPGLRPESAIFIGRLPYFTDEHCLRTALLKLLDNRPERTHRHGRYRSPQPGRTKHCSRSRSRSPFVQSNSSQVDEVEWPQIHMVKDLVTGYPCGYAFAYFAQPEDAHQLLRNWSRSTLNTSPNNTTDRFNSKGSIQRAGLDIPDGQKVILEPAFGATLPGWKPRRLGGGLGGRKEAGQLRFGGVARPFRRPFNL